MSDRTILVIDDSSTIRKLVDTYLSPIGYQVVLAGTADEGLRLVGEVLPDMILLDHQLPGTTGFEVCKQLWESPEYRKIPIVISSTLRKKAYVEYTDMANVVDMLPKPYTAELLTTTIANALDTGSLIVASQSEGTAIPEVIDEVDEGDMHGAFGTFCLRELLDFLNHGRKSGVLEVEAERARVFYYLNNGRVQGVSANGIDADQLTRYLPEALQSLAPVMRMTLAGRGCADADGIVQLLDQKVLDTRLMTRLLRFQASSLVLKCFRGQLGRFRFDSRRSVPSIHRKLPLDISLLALLVDGASHCDLAELPPVSQDTLFARQAVRGQNLDRAGLSAQHMNILGLLSEPRSLSDLVTRLKQPEREVRRVLYGLSLAELVNVETGNKLRQFVLFEPNSEIAQQMRAALAAYEDRVAVKVVRDGLALQLVLKRTAPDAIVFAADSKDALRIVRGLFTRGKVNLDNVRAVAVVGEDAGEQNEAFWKEWSDKLGRQLDAALTRPYTAEQTVKVLEQLFEGPRNPDPLGPTTPAPRRAEEPVVTGVS